MKRYLLLTFCIWCSFSSHVSAANMESVQTFLSQYAKSANENDQTGPALSRLYLQSFLTITPTALDDIQLNKLFRALDIVSFYTNDRDATTKLKSVAEELARRKELKPWQNLRVAEALASARLNDRLEEFAAKHPSRSDILSVPDADHIERALHTEKSQAIWTEKFRFPPGGFLIVVGDPRCHFTVSAAEEFGKDPELSKMLNTRSKWVIPQVRGLTMSLLTQWNSAHEPFRMSVVHLEKQWPEITDWATPTFYFYRDGVLVEQQIGWHGPRRLQDIVDGLKRVGLDVRNQN